MVAQSHFDRVIRWIVQKEQVAARIWKDVHGAFFQQLNSAGSGIKRFCYCTRDITTTIQDNIKCRTPVKFQCYYISILPNKIEEVIAHAYAIDIGTCAHLNIAARRRALGEEFHFKRVVLHPCIGLRLPNVPNGCIDGIAVGLSDGSGIVGIGWIFTKQGDEKSAGSEVRTCGRRVRAIGIVQVDVGRIEEVFPNHAHGSTPRLGVVSSLEVAFG